MATPLDPNSLAQTKDIQELAIAISAKNLTPTMLSEDFLKFSGIVPSEWEASKQPVLTPNLAQITFQNGVNIVAQPRSINFMEGIGNKKAEEIEIPKIARQYVEKLPNAEYQSLSISPKSLVPLPGSQDAARKYITGILLAPGSWQEIGKAPMQAAINLLYELEGCQLTLNINEAKLQLAEGKALPGLLFSGSFNYNISGNTPPERMQGLTRSLDRWQSDWKVFREIVHEKFLGQQQSVFPFG